MSARRARGQGNVRKRKTHVNPNSALVYSTSSLFLPPPTLTLRSLQDRTAPGFTTHDRPWISLSPSRSVNISSSPPSVSSRRPYPSRSVSTSRLCHTSMLTARARVVDPYPRVGPFHLRAREGQRGEPGCHRRPCRRQQCFAETNHGRLGYYAPAPEDSRVERCA